MAGEGGHLCWQVVPSCLVLCSTRPNQTSPSEGLDAWIQSLVTKKQRGYHLAQWKTIVQDIINCNKMYFMYIKCISCIYVIVLICVSMYFT